MKLGPQKPQVKKWVEAVLTTSVIFLYLVQNDGLRISVPKSSSRVLEAIPQEKNNIKKNENIVTLILKYIH